MEHDVFLARLHDEFTRLGISEHDARFTNILSVDECILKILAALPDGSGPGTFYSNLGANCEKLKHQEREWAAMSDAERRDWGRTH